MRILLTSGRAVAATLGSSRRRGLARVRHGRRTTSSRRRPGHHRSDRRCSRRRARPRVRNGALSRAAHRHGRRQRARGSSAACSPTNGRRARRSCRTTRRTSARSSSNNATVNASSAQLYRVRTAANQAIALLNKCSPTPTVGHRRDVFRARIRRAAAGVGLLQRHSAERRHRRISTLRQAAAGDGGVRAWRSRRSTRRWPSAAAPMRRACRSTARARIGKARALLGLSLDNAGGGRGRSPRDADDASGTTSRRRSPAATTCCGASRQPAPLHRRRQRRGERRNMLVKNAIPFFSAKDPRVPAKYTIAHEGRTRRSRRTASPSRGRRRCGTSTTSTLPLVNGIDARLIEAEGRSEASDSPG